MKITMKNYGLTQFELHSLAYIYDQIIQNSTGIRGNRYAIYTFDLLITFQQKLAMNRCFNKFFTSKAKDPLMMNTLDSLLPSIFFISYIHNASQKTSGGYWIQIKTTDDIHLTFSRELFYKITDFVDEMKDKGIYNQGEK